MEPSHGHKEASSEDLHCSRRMINLVANPQQHASLASALIRPEPRLSDGFSLVGVFGGGSQRSLLPQDLTLPAPCPSLEQQYRSQLWSQLHRQQQILQLQMLMASAPQLTPQQLQMPPMQTLAPAPAASSAIDHGRRVTTEAVPRPAVAAAPARLAHKADPRPARISTCSNTSAGTAAPSPTASKQQQQLACPQRYFAPDSPAEESHRTGDSSPRLLSAPSLDSEDLSQRPIIGLTYHRTDRAWRAIIRVSGKRVHLGQKRDMDEAARLYDSAAYFMFKGEARLNFPDEAHPAPDVDTCTKLKLQARGQPQVQIEQWMAHPMPQPGAVPVLVPLNPAVPHSNKRASSSSEEAPYKKHGYTHHRASPPPKPACLLSSLLMLAAVAEQELGRDSPSVQQVSPSRAAPWSPASDPTYLLPDATLSQ